MHSMKAKLHMQLFPTENINYNTDACREISLPITQLGSNVKCSSVYKPHVTLIKTQLSKYQLKDTIILLYQMGNMEDAQLSKLKVKVYIYGQN